MAKPLKLMMTVTVVKNKGHTIQKTLEVFKSSWSGKKMFEHEELYFQQEGHPYTIITMSDPTLMRFYQNRWSEREGFMEYTSRSPDLASLDSLCKYFQENFYAMKPAKGVEIKEVIGREWPQQQTTCLWYLRFHCFALSADLDQCPVVWGLVNA